MTPEFIEQLEAKHEKECLTLIDERDAAEQSLSQAYYLTVGHSPEWSNNFGHQHALQDIGDAVALLKDAAKSAIERAERYRKALYLISIVEQGCGGTLTFEEMANSAMAQARDALKEPT